MSRPDEDPGLTAAFSALRREEEGHCPSFAEVLRAARVRSRGSVNRWRLVTAMAAAGIAIALLALWTGPWTGKPRMPRETLPSIAEWRSPTGFLLETPGREVLAAPAGLGPSVLDLGQTRLTPPSERRSPS